MPIETQRIARIVVEDVPTAVACNKCGDRYEEPDGRLDLGDGAQRFHHFRVGGGYATVFPQDLTTVDFVLCASCLRDLVGSLAVPARVTSAYQLEPDVAFRVSDDAKLWVTSEWVSSLRSLVQDQEGEGLTWTDEDHARPWPVLGGLYCRDGGGRMLEVAACVLDLDDDSCPSVVFRAIRESPVLWVTTLRDWTAAGLTPVDLGAGRDAASVEDDGSDEPEVDRG